MLKVSVIIPIYNVKKYIVECLESLMQQSLQECEFICVDDGSPDDSYRIVEAYEKRDGRFRLIRQENKGLAEARNVGIREAKGRYIAFLDADDCFREQEALKELYNVAEEKKTDFVTFDAECFYESDLLSKTDNRDSYYNRKREYGLCTSGRRLFCELMENDDFCDGAWVIFFKRDWMMVNHLWFTVGLYPEDCIWSFQCYMRAGKVIHIQKKYYKYRIRSNSLTTEKVSFDVIYGRIYTVREIIRFVLTNSLSEREENAICKFVDIILWHIKDKFLKLEISEAYRLRELSPLDRLLAGYMNYPVPDDLKFNFLVYMRGFKSILEEASGLIIYGAGKMGRLVHQYIKKEKLSGLFLGFAVSEAPFGEVGKEDSMPCSIYNESWPKDALAVVAVFSEESREKMTIMAKEAGFTRILPVDTYMLRILEEYYD